MTARSASRARSSASVSRPGDRVATMLPPSLDYLAAWFGVVWAGAVDVPVNVDFKGEFLRHVVGGSGAKVLIVDARWLERLDGLDLPRPAGDHRRRRCTARCPAAARR